jgi:hypothetical protein
VLLAQLGRGLLIYQKRCNDQTMLRSLSRSPEGAFWVQGDVPALHKLGRCSGLLFLQSMLLLISRSLLLSLLVLIVAMLKQASIE